MEAARRMSFPATEIDCIGRFRERKDGWRRRSCNGGSGGGGGREFHVEDIGSKVKIRTEVEGNLVDFDHSRSGVEEDRKVYRERKGGKEGE